jgi:diguanylate cyclase (GGDEF)-like protein
LSETDPLTSTLNRRGFLKVGEREMERARRRGELLPVVMLDIDHFKDINDHYGHRAGDQVLRAFAAAVRSRLRKSDAFGRVGGEEFALLLPETTLDQAKVVAERIRRDVEAITVPHGNTPIRFTCSIGVAEQTPAVNDLDGLLRTADAALYRAKAEGRNRVA